MAATATSDLSGNFKDRYGKMSDLVPEFAIYAQDFPFQSDAKLGDEYVHSVVVRRSQSVTWAGATSGGTAFDLKDARPGKVVDARISSVEMVIRDQVATSVIERARTSEQAFKNSFDHITLSMMQTGAFHRELALIYGGTSIGTIEAEADSGATSDLTITVGTFAAGIWSQMEGGVIDVYDPTLTTKRNTNPLEITAVDSENRVLSVAGTVSGDVSGIAVGDVLVPHGAVGEWFNGAHKVLTNTGLLHNINASTYGLWKANSFPVGGVEATLHTFLHSAGQMVPRGGTVPLTYYISTKTWTDLNNDHAALRRIAEKEQADLTLGSEKISYFGPNGRIDLKAHAMIMPSIAHGMYKESWRRAGVYDLKFEADVQNGVENYFFILPTKSGYELRVHGDQYFLCTMPASNVLVTGIVNSTDV